MSAAVPLEGFVHEYRLPPDAVQRAYESGLGTYVLALDRWKVGDWLNSGQPDPDVLLVIRQLASPANSLPGRASRRSASEATLKTWAKMAQRWTAGEREYSGTAFTVYQELVKVESDALVAEMFGRCAAWYADNGSPPGHKRVRAWLKESGTPEAQLQLEGLDPRDVVYVAVTGEMFRG